MAPVWRNVLLRGFAAWCVLVAIGFYFGESVSRVFVPAYDVTARALMNNYAPAFEFVDVNKKRSIQMTATTIRPIPLTEDVTVPVGRALPSSITVLHSLVPIVILLTLVVAWPFASWRALLVRLILAVPFILLVQVLTAPPQLIGNLEIGIQNAIRQMGGSRETPWVIRWMLFMEGGGRWVLPLVAAFICISFTDARSETRGSTSPS